jgi:hypothetical protein
MGLPDVLFCEDRLRAARFFYEKSNTEEAESWDEQVWYLQATVLFIMSGLEVLQYDFAERRKLATRGENLDLSDFKKRAKGSTNFYEWLESEFQKESYYGFFKSRRNLIIHRGERSPVLRPKKIKAKFEPIRDEQVTVFTMHFEGLESESIQTVCEKMLDWAESLVSGAKGLYPELA